MQNHRKRFQKNREGKPNNRRNGNKISWFKVFFIQIISAIILTSCQQVIIEEGTIDVYFCPDCEDIFVDFIDEKTICAFYDLDSKPLINVLDEKTTLVFEENYDDFGIPVESLGLMHNKFCVKNNLVITGSTNPTERGFNLNNNNLLIIKSETIASNYRDEYFELKSRGSSKTKNTLINLSGTLVANYFCPEDDCEEKVLQVLNQAEHSIYFMTFSFTSDAIGDLLVVKKQEGLDVRGIMESFGLNKYAEKDKLEAVGVPIVLERTGAIMHHKVFIVDNSIVITGSYNPTKSATERNDENILIIHNEEIAKQFLEEFEKIHSELN